MREARSQPGGERLGKTGVRRMEISHGIARILAETFRAFGLVEVEPRELTGDWVRPMLPSPVRPETPLKIFRVESDALALFVRAETLDQALDRFNSYQRESCGVSDLIRSVQCLPEECI